MEVHFCVWGRIVFSHQTSYKLRVLCCDHGKRFNPLPHTLSVILKRTKKSVSVSTLTRWRDDESGGFSGWWCFTVRHMCAHRFHYIYIRYMWIECCRSSCPAAYALALNYRAKSQCAAFPVFAVFVCETNTHIYICVWHTETQPVYIRVFGRASICQLDTVSQKAFITRKANKLKTTAQAEATCNLVDTSILCFIYDYVYYCIVGCSWVCVVVV